MTSILSFFFLTTFLISLRVLYIVDYFVLHAFYSYDVHIQVLITERSCGTLQMLNVGCIEYKKCG